LTIHHDSAHPPQARASPISSRPKGKLESRRHDQEQDSLGMSSLELRARGLMQSLSCLFALRYVFRWQGLARRRIRGAKVESRVERRLKDVLDRWLDVVYLQSGIDSRSGNESRLSLQTSDWLRPCGWRWKASLGGDASGENKAWRS
jgi:hypothetical protein